MHDGYYLMLDAFARGIEPDSNLPVDVWADRHMIVPKETGASEPGPYKTSRTPHARMVMQALSADHPCKRIVVMGASQMLKTQVALNFLGETVHQRPKNFLWVVPTGKLHKRAAARIDKMVAAVPVLRERFARPASRVSTNNNDIKAYPGGALYIATAGAAANLSELSVTYVVYDEVDRSKDNVGGEGSPDELVETRQTSHQRDKKTYYPSSPTIEGESPIQTLHDRGTQRVALAECIHCGEAQSLEFFDDNGAPRLIRSDDGKQAFYPCTVCGGLHSEGDKTRMFARGLWSEGVPGDGETESFQISGMFLPYGWLPWVALLNQYEKAKAQLEEGSEESMIVFYNTRLAKCWARSKETTRYEGLMARAETYRLGGVPAGGVMLTAAIDVQAYRLEFQVMAWGDGMECWVIDYQVIHGDPASQQTWDKADELLKARYRHASGALMNISAAFVDSGGHHTQEVYTFTQARRHRNIYAVKGDANKKNRPIVGNKPSNVGVDKRGKVERNGVKLWIIGTDTAKDYLQTRWGRAQGPGAMHFSQSLPESWFKGLTAEYRTSGFKRGRKVSWWEQKKGEPNEPLDLSVYNLAAAFMLGLHRKSEHAWQLLRDRLVPAVGDLFDQEQHRPIDVDTESPAAAEPGTTPPPPATRAGPAPTAGSPAVVNGRISLGGLRRGGK
ncbi:phage terminase large subunit family protein [Hydrogenophaga taeniospiralis]|uniref:phage terminase large subunit family protein n=1 Tax=Hydrogenophaga taeniospiralis TaxID=65656 RepID=UPI001CF9EB6F|nr:terminase gpA endonuclease subunit [Hydrogenophaga taeniospiralis]